MRQLLDLLRRRAGFAHPPRSAGTAQCATNPLPHPYDTATGTIVLGLALTGVLVLLLRQLAG